MTNFPPDYNDKLCAAISEWLRRSGEIADANQNRPAEGSPAMVEQSNSDRADLLMSACSIACLMIESGAEHLSLFVDTITEPVDSLACWTTVRSLLEPCALSSWLLDPAISPEDRLGRSFALRFSGLQEQLKFVRSINQPYAAVAAIEDRMNSLESSAGQLGYPPLSRSGRRTGIGQRMPGATALIESELGLESAYRLLSAVSHGHTWAISQLGFRDTGGSGELIGSVQTRAIEKGLNLNSVAYLALQGSLAFAHALWNQCRYFGWEPNPVEETFEDVFDRMAIGTSIRFWRSMQ